MANKITTVIQNFPPAPDSSTDTEAAFNAKADAFVAHQAGTYVAEVNTWATEANSLVTGVNTSEVNAKASEVEAKKQADRAVAAASTSIPPVAGNAGKVLEVNSTGTSIEWVTLPQPDLSKYLPLTGGHIQGNLELGTEAKTAMFSSTATWGCLMMYGDNSGTDGYFGIKPTGQIYFHPKAGQSVVIDNKEVVTGKKNGAALELYLGGTLVKTIP